MTRYILSRLLLLPVKLFFVTLLLFCGVNLVGAPALDDSETVGATGNVAWANFRRQYHLDLPVLVNLRWRTTTTDVRRWLTEANGDDPALRAASREKLDDYGVEILPALTEIVSVAGRAWALDKQHRPKSGEVLDLEPGWPLTAPFQVEGGGPGVFDGPSHSTGRNGAKRPPSRERGSPSARIGEAGLAEDPVVLDAERRRKVLAGAPPRDAAAGVLRQSMCETRFAFYLKRLARLDFGDSTLTGQPVLTSILSRLPCSALLAGTSITLAWLLAVPLGVYGAARRGSRADATLTLLLFALFSLPTFFTGTTLLQLLSTGAGRVFPSGGLTTPESSDYTALQRLGDVAWHLILPVTTYTTAILASLSRFARVGVLDVIQSDYVRTARAKGLEEGVVLISHAARNGLLPILTVLGGNLASLVAGSVVIETVFNLPGMGRYLFEAIFNRDYNAVMGALLFSSALTLLGVFLADLAYASADPRISLE